MACLLAQNMLKRNIYYNHEAFLDFFKHDQHIQPKGKGERNMFPDLIFRSTTKMSILKR